MNTYIATFHTHFGAMSFYKQITSQEIYAKLMPVPRTLSSSCGTCCMFKHDNSDFNGEDLEEIFIVQNDKYIAV